jgi:hypothetical protein
MVLAFAGDSTTTTSIEAFRAGVNVLAIGTGSAIRQPKAGNILEKIRLHFVGNALKDAKSG